MFRKRNVQTDNLLSIPADELSDTITNEVRAMLARVDRIDFLNYG